METSSINKNFEVLRNHKVYKVKVLYELVDCFPIPRIAFVHDFYIRSTSATLTQHAEFPRP